MKKKRNLEEIYKDMGNCSRGKEIRKLHKELKQYGDGIPFIDRYPMFPTIISVLSLIFSVLAIAIRTVL